jgi:hypothetical protein
MIWFLIKLISLIISLTHCPAKVALDGTQGDKKNGTQWSYPYPWPSLNLSKNNYEYKLEGHESMNQRPGFMNKRPLISDGNYIFVAVVTWTQNHV